MSTNSTGAAHDPDSVALPPGTELDGRYRLEHPLGAGGFGIVYLAWDEKLHRNVAIKEFLPALVATRHHSSSVVPRNTKEQHAFEVGRLQFLQEAELLASFGHPYVVQAFDSFEANGTAYLVMQYYSGAKTLEAALTDGSFKPTHELVLRLFDDLCDALAAVHERGLTHRDVAPDNILILSDGRPVLIDFGGARDCVAGLTTTMEALRKPGYSAIEQYHTQTAGDEPEVGPWSDVYSLSAVIYRVITGLKPVDAPSRVTADRMKSLADFPAARAYPRRFIDSITAGLSFTRRTRPQSIQELRRQVAVARPKRMPLKLLVALALALGLGALGNRYVTGCWVGCWGAAAPASTIDCSQISDPAEVAECLLRQQRENNDQ